MSLKINYDVKEINGKQKLLESAAKILKEEFIGIDVVIDKVIESLNTWFLFPQLQDRPVVINLWGMTGVGKTALILRLANLLNYDNRLFRYDIGNSSVGYTSLKELLKDAFQYNNGIPYMIMLDEFQYAKTKDEDANEVDNHFSRVIWDLLDSGKFQSPQQNAHYIEQLGKWEKILSDCLKEGVEVDNGIVIKHKNIFIDIVSHKPDNNYEDIEDDHTIKSNDKTVYTFLPKNLYKILYICLLEKNKTVIQFKKMISRMDGPQTIEILNKAIECAKSNNWIDCTKTVIFILGNLDEAYTMSSTFNPDINANEFHDASKYININHIKQALKSRFRNEQISRLGNNHIIYPAFNEDSFKKIIELELSKITAKTSAQFACKLTFSESFKSLIYSEGVFPTQGTRPVFSTIYQLVNTKIPMLITRGLLNNNYADVIRFDFKEDHINYEFYKDGLTLYIVQDYIELSMEKLRAPTRDDLQAITAVHEAGHAITLMKALKVLPAYICSTSADVQNMGFMLVKSKWKYFAKEEIIPRIAVFLSGIAAEKIIFGQNKITKGSGEDIKLATDLASKSIKDYGMGSLKAKINIADYLTKYCYHDNKGEWNNEVKTLLQDAHTLAENILTSEKILLLKLADSLSDERTIKKEEIEKKVREFGSPELRDITFIEEGDNLYYRNELKTQVQKITNPRQHSINTEEIVIALNKKA